MCVSSAGTVIFTPPLDPLKEKNPALCVSGSHTWALKEALLLPSNPDRYLLKLNDDGQFLLMPAFFKA